MSREYKTDNGYDVREDRTVCHVCMHHCSLSEGQTGRCRARKAAGGRVESINYGKVTALMLDPVEKKPLRHFFPGSSVLSAGSFGCNLSCPFCQNHDISMAGEKDTYYRQIEPDELVCLALTYKEQGNIGIAFTYNEPMVGYEYVRDTARLVHEHGMKNIVVTNGSVTLSVLEEVLPFADAMNIDLKGFSAGWYEKLGGNLEMVKDFIKKAAGKCHVELTTLVVPGENDSFQEMEEEARWIASVDPKIVLHITRFFPRYNMQDRKETDVKRIYELRDRASRYLTYVYTGNC